MVRPQEETPSSSGSQETNMPIKDKVVVEAEIKLKEPTEPDFDIPTKSAEQSTSMHSISF